MSFFDRHFPHWPPGVPKSLSVPRTSLYYNLEVSARRYPDKPAVLYYGSALSYAALDREVAALAGFLQQRCGLARGDRVLLYAQNSPQFIIGYYAILRADGVVVPVNPMNKTDELAHYIGDSDARVAIAAQELYREIEPHLGKGRIEHCVLAAYGDFLEEKTNPPRPRHRVAQRARGRCGRTFLSRAASASHRAETRPIEITGIAHRAIAGAKCRRAQCPQAHRSARERCDRRGAREERD